MAEKTEFIMFIGLPASGKSTLAAKYRSAGYSVFSSDAVRAEIEAAIEKGEFVLPSNNNLNGVVFERIVREVAEEIKKGNSVVLDATNLTRKRRMNFKRWLCRYHCLMKCILFITPVSVCMERNANRIGSARVPDEAMDNMLRSFECPNYWEGWDEIVPIIDETPYAFDFEKTIGFLQETPHHSLTLYDHMAKAKEYVKEHGGNEMLQRVAMYHDIGKFHVKKFENRKGEPSEFAHFYEHENYGAYLYLTEKCCGKTLTKEEFDEVLYETCLINCHMRPLHFWKPDGKAREKDKRLFGERFFADLVALNAADRAAH